MGGADGSSKKTFSRSGFKFEVGFRIELLETGIWYACKILQVDWEKELILIHYERWSHKFDEWVPMSSPDIRPCKDKSWQKKEVKLHFRVREDVFAVWSDGRRYPGSVQAVLPNDRYQVMFFDGFVKNLRWKQLSKWTRENEQRFGSVDSALETVPSSLAATAAGAVTAGPSGFVPEVLETKRKRKTNPIVEELLGPKRARRQQREENEARHRSPSAPSTSSAASTPGGSSRKQSWAISSREDADADSAETGSEWEDSVVEEDEEPAEEEEQENDVEEVEIDDSEEEQEGEEEDEEGTAEEDSVYSESVVSIDDTASSSYRSVSPAAPTPSPAPAPARLEDPTAEQDLPPGWRRVLTPRAWQGNRLDITLYAPDGSRFRSRAELERFVQRTGAVGLDPVVMFRRPPRDRGAARRRFSRPSFTTASGSLSQPAGSSEDTGSGGGRPSFTSTPSDPGTGSTAAARGEEVHKKLGRGWALEPIVDEPSEPEQSDFPCVDSDCNKRFRKERMLQMHMKHYHPELRHLVNAGSASVARQAETRTMKSLLPSVAESTVGTPGRATGRLRSTAESSVEMPSRVTGRLRSTGESSVETPGRVAGRLRSTGESSVETLGRAAGRLRSTGESSVDTPDRRLRSAGASTTETPGRATGRLRSVDESAVETPGRKLRSVGESTVEAPGRKPRSAAESTVETPGRKLRSVAESSVEAPGRKLRSAGESNVRAPVRTSSRRWPLGELITASGGGRERRRGSSDERSSAPESAPSPLPPSPPPPPLAADSPLETPAADSPLETPAADSPMEARAVSPRETPAADIPQETPAMDSPRETRAADSLHATSAAESPRETPAADSPRETPAADSSQASPAADSSQASPAADSPQPAPTGAAIPPTDDPKLLAEPVVSVRSYVRQLTESSVESRASSSTTERSFRRPRRRQRTTSEDGRGELSELIAIVEHESPQKPGRRTTGRQPRRPTDPGEGYERGEDGRLHSYASLEDVASPGSPAPSSASVRGDTDAGLEDDLASESGAGDKLTHHEVIRCACGVQDEDGLMIQCELCLAWQHGVCLGITSDTEVPSSYVCNTCRHPWRVRHSQRYVWEQQMFRDGALIRLPFGGEDAAFERAQAVMRAACDLTANVLSLQAVINSLRTKIAIASDLNHPKLYLWARPWSPPPGQDDDQSEMSAPAANSQSQTVNKTGDQSETTPVITDSQSAPVPGGENQSEPASATTDHSESLLEAALESPALLAAVNSAAAELGAAPAGLADHVTPPAELDAGHVAAEAPGSAMQNGVPSPATAAEADPLAHLSSDQTALLNASLAAAGDSMSTPAAADGATAGSAASESGPEKPPTAPEATPAGGAAEATSASADGSASTDGSPPAVGGSETPAAAPAGEREPAVAATGEAAPAPAPSAEGSEPMEETDDPLSGVLDAIVGLLPSQSDLDQLMDGPEAEPTPAPPAAPVGEARIDPATCQLNLLQHVNQMQAALMARLDTVEQHVEALEKVAELEPDWDGERPELCRGLLHSVLRDIKLIERLGRLS